MSPLDVFFLPPRQLMEDAEDIEQRHSSPNTVNSIYCYPGSDTTFSSNVHLALYDEEESCEQLAIHEGLQLKSDSQPKTDIPEANAANRPTIYHILRLFDSIRGYHKGYLDLSGRHPERYYDLQIQWNSFLCGFLSLETELRTCTELTALGVSNRYHVLLNADLWRRFQLKWRLPDSATYNQLLICTQKVLRELKQRPMPLFQILCLTDLPIEVLDNIVGLASTAQAKALSCTCHILNDVGQRHIFRTWRIKLHVPPHISPFNVEYSSLDLPTLAHYSREDLEKHADFILSTPHISRCIQTLVLTDEWWVSRRAHPHEHNPYILGMDFYKSVTQIFGSILKSAPKLSTLVLCNLEINIELARRISEMPTLHTIELHLCHITRMVRKKITAEAAFVWTQIANLRIFMDSSFQETHSQWHGLLLSPNVRTLSVIQFGIGAFPTPDAAFWRRCRLDSLERLSLDNIDAGDLAEFTNFLAENKSATAYMTHFKLHMDWGIFDAEALTLLLALQNAPLSVLVLEGLAEAEVSLLDRIAYQYPDLIALTLVRRQNSNQHQNKLAIWPHPSWEYAPSFRGFKALQHFCWNFLTEYWDATPATLLAFESDFSSNKLDSDSNDEVPYFLDSHWMALPFVAHCTTLQSFSLMDRGIDMVCRISRDADNRRTTLIPKYFPTHPSISNVQQWNTTSSHWPILFPLTKPRSAA